MKYHRRFALFRMLPLTVLCAAQVAGIAPLHALPGPPPVAPEPPLPGYLQSTTDTWSLARFTRITRPGALGSGIVCGSDYCTHRYSSSQAWNADQTLLVIANGCNGLCFLDGQTYRPLFYRERQTACEWSPVDPRRMICVGGRTISLWMPRSNVEKGLFSSPQYDKLEFGPGKGNPSRDGNRIVVRARRADGALVAFAYDLASGRKFPDINLGALPGKNSSCSISPLGTYIICFQSVDESNEPIFVFSVDGDLRQAWLENQRPGHGDMTVDADGSEVYVGISKSDPDIYQVIKRRLSDGEVTSLMPYGEGQHVSARAIDEPGWVYVTYAGGHSEVAQHPHWAPFAREIIAVALDGSGRTRRIAETYRVPSGYWSESHASPSPDGSQVIWSSNWGQRGGPVYDFVSRPSALDRGKAFWRVSK